MIILPREFYLSWECKALQGTLVFGTVVRHFPAERRTASTAGSGGDMGSREQSGVWLQIGARAGVQAALALWEGGTQSYL